MNQQTTELPNGKIVCADHHLELCGICCMDFTDINSDFERSSKSSKKYFTDSFGYRYCKEHDEESCKKCGVNETAYNKRIEAKEKEKKKKDSQPNSHKNNNNNNNNNTFQTASRSNNNNNNTSTSATTITTTPSNDDDSMPNLVSESDIQYCDDKRKEGNAHFSRHDYRGALKSYSDGIERDPYCLTLLSNRSACYLNLNNPAEALKDAEKVCAIDRDHIKGNFRRIKSLVLLNRVREAQTLFRDFRGKFPTDQYIGELTTLFENVQINSTESQSQTQTETRTQTPAPTPSRSTSTPTKPTPNKEPGKREEKPTVVYEEEGPRPIVREKKIECTICMENEVQIMLRPCGHAVLCRECFKSLPEKTCPICRSPIKRTFQVYL